jgi:hypothetical protein
LQRVHGALEAGLGAQKGLSSWKGAPIALDERNEQDTVGLAGQVIAQADVSQSLQLPSSLRSRRLPGLTSDTRDGGTLGRAYDAALVAAATAFAQKQ